MGHQVAGRHIFDRKRAKLVDEPTALLTVKSALRAARFAPGVHRSARNGCGRPQRILQTLTLPMAEARGFSRPAGEAHRASAPAPAGSALRDGSAPPEAHDGVGGGMVRSLTHEATA